MSKFEIYTDSSCDLAREIIEKYDLKVMQLEVTIDDQPPVLNCDIGAHTGPGVIALCYLGKTIKGTKM